MSTGSSAQVSRRGVRPRLRDTGIRAKLALILVIPVIAVVALATARLVDVGRRVNTATQVQQLTAAGVDISSLSQLLQAERMAAATFLATPNTPGSQLAAAVKATDAQIQRYKNDRQDFGDQPPMVRDQLKQIDEHLSALSATRTKVSTRDGIAVADAVSRYGVVLTDLIGYGTAVSQFAGNGVVGDGLSALAAFARAKSGTADQEAIAYAARVTGDSSAEQRAAFIATQTRQQQAFLEFTVLASTSQRAVVTRLVSGDPVNLADQVSTRLARSGNVTPGEITDSFSAVVELMRRAEQQLELDIARQADAERDSAVQQAVIESVLVLLALIVALAIAAVTARSLNLSLRRLREGALAVANRDLPEVVARLRDARNLGEGGADGIVRELRDPIQLDTRDEIGQVADAFNAVHREAVRIAADQAALRTSVSTMFLNLARRSQSLVDRMIGELDQIERTEEDPKRLARLFELDHLATRMRRNDENLLVLAGADSSAPRREDALLVDALRAAQSEIELYNRVEFGTVDTDISIGALAVNDVVRLIAELLDNATRFSPPNTVVVADARRSQDQVVIQVEDRGLGMSAEQLDQLNRRLSERAGVDAGAFRLMGLAVVGQLAARYDIEVELRAALDGGIVAEVTLPSSIVVLPPRATDLPRRNNGPTSEVGGPSGAWETLSGSRSATATLPAISAQPWRDEPESVTRPAPVVESSARPVVVQPPVPVAGHPQLPMFPSQRPRGDKPLTPATPNRPPLPTRVMQSMSGQPSLDALVTPPVSAPPVPAELEALPPDISAATTAVFPAVFPMTSVAPAATPTAAEQTGWRTEPSSFRPVSPVPAAPERIAPGSAGPISAVPASAVPASAAPASAAPASAAPASAAPASAASVSASPISSGPVSARPLSTEPETIPTVAVVPTDERTDSPIFVEMQQSWFRNHNGQTPSQWGMPTAGYAPPPEVSPALAASPTAAHPMVTGSVAALAAAGQTKPSQTWASQSQPSQAQPSQAQPSQAQPSQAQPSQAQPSQAQPSQAQPSQAQPSQAQPSQAQPSQAQPSQSAPRAGHGSAGPGEAAPGSLASDSGVPKPRPAAEEHWRTPADEGWARAIAAAEPVDAGTTRSGLPKRVPQAQLVPGGVQSGPGALNRRTPEEVRGLLAAYHRGVQRGRNDGTSDTDSAFGQENDR